MSDGSISFLGIRPNVRDVASHAEWHARRAESRKAKCPRASRGSMTLFGTAGIRGSAVETVTPELALAVGRAAGRDDTEFVVARDGRETGTALAAAMEAGLESAGTDVRRAGQLPTPALAFASQGRRGVMVTASHNPPTDNGIKLFVDGKEYDSAAEARIEDRVDDG